MPEPDVRIGLNIQDRRTFKCVPCKNAYIQFTVKINNTGLYIGLFTAHDILEESTFTNPKYVFEVAVDPGIDSKIVLRKKGIDHNLKIASIPFILHNEEWRGLWVSCSKENISFGREHECEPILSWKDSDFEPIIKLGFRLEPYVPFFENFDNGPQGADIIIDTLTHSKPIGIRWLKCAYGEIPENPFVGGYNDGKAIYVIRAYVQRALTPGILIKGNAHGKVGWGSYTHCMDNYEVLAGFSGNWVKTRNDKIPPLALVAGRTENNCPLYIGRTTFEGILVLGKVQPDHRCFYPPFQGGEPRCEEYEILCHNPPGLPVIPHPLAETKNKEPKWVYSCNGRVPRNAFIVGYQDKTVVLIRGKYDGKWFPGWMRSSDASGHIGISYFSIDVEEYEVLCDFGGYWEKPNLQLPDNAYEMHNGLDEEKIYIGKVWHRGKLYCGRVKNMVCEFSCNDHVIQEPDFEVLCFPNEVKSQLKTD